MRDVLPEDLLARIAALSPEKRALLEQQLRQTQDPPSLSASIADPGLQDPVPLSFAQERLWFLDQLQPESPLYNIPIALRLRGPLQYEYLQEALSMVVARHQVFRTRILAPQGIPEQHIDPPRSVPLTLLDVKPTPGYTPEATLKDTLHQEAGRPFDLTRGLMLRATLARLGAEDHALLLVVHHIAFDGWSIPLLLKELAACYQARQEKRPPLLGEPSLQYAAYARWQQQRHDEGSLDRELHYWKQKLGGTLPLLNLPTDRPRPSKQTTAGAHHTFWLSEAVIDGVRALSRSEHASLFMTMLAAFNVLLHRYTDQDDLLVGGPIANRRHIEVDGLIGLLVNTLVYRTDLSGDPTFRDLLRQVRETALEAYAHQELPFERLVAALQPTRDPAYTPLFQVLFALTARAPNTFTLPGVESETLPINTGTAKFDLSLAFNETKDGLQGTLIYKTALFEAGTIERMEGHLCTLLEAIVEHPDTPISRLPLLDEQERHRLLVAWNDTSRPYPSDRCIHELFEHQVLRTPDALALSFGEEHLTYGDLNARANQLARHLRHLGVGPEQLVGLCLDRSADLFIGLLGILKAGGAFLPLDPSYPTARLALMLAEARPTLLLTARPHAALFDDFGSPQLFLDEEQHTLVAYRRDNLAPSTGPHSLAYVIYTSGSSGSPKGVMIEHQALVNFSTATAEAYALTPQDTVLQFAPISFDGALDEIMPALIAGATLAPRSDTMLDSIPAFLQACARKAITVLVLPTAFWHELALTMPAAALQLPPSVRLISIGGEYARPDCWAAWKAHIGEPIDLINGYGPTETTVVTTHCVITSDALMLAEGEAPPIGKPLPNMKAYVLDRYGNPVPVGVPGELHIGGPGVARGYLNRPDLTEERFIADPFSQEPIARLYKTGDRVRYRPDGHLAFLGRTDRQVKIRGFRVEPGEIETILHTHPAIEQAAVIVQEQAPHHARLDAFVVPAASASLSVPCVHRFLKEQLPDYMIPTSFTVLEALPLSASDKLDRAALSRLDTSPWQGSSEDDTPQTPTEKVLASIWSAAFDRPHIHRHDDFFDLGGHSLLAIRIAAQIQDALQVTLPLRTFFETPTLADLATAITSLGSKEDLASSSDSRCLA